LGILKQQRLRKGPGTKKDLKKSNPKENLSLFSDGRKSKRKKKSRTMGVAEKKKRTWAEEITFKNPINKPEKPAEN